jgi:hypothetical protein
MTHVERTPGRFAYDRESFGQKLVERFAGLEALPERFGSGAQVSIAELLDLRLERVDLANGALILLEQPIVAAAEDFPE